MASVLLVEDDKMLLESLLKLFSALARDLEVMPAEHGREALAILEARPIDILVTDLQMPVMDGFELLAAMIGRGLVLPVIVMSGVSALETEEPLQRVGAASCLRKPVPFRALAAEIRRRLQDADRPGLSLGLPTLLELLQIERRTCTVRIRSMSRQGTLGFVVGELVNAACETMEPIAAACAMLSWERPEVEIDGASPIPGSLLRISLRQVFMEAERRVHG
jgi:CheY-like chemotaxis protein